METSKIIRHYDSINTRFLLLHFSVVFLISRIVFYLAGVRFDNSIMNWWMHFMDIELLKNILIQSLYYFHSQPPLYNLFLGIILKLFPSDAVLAIHVMYTFFGFVLGCTLLLVQVKLGVTKFTAIILSILFTISPSFILYENWIFYTMPLAMLLVISVLFLSRFLESNHLIDAAGFFASLFILCGIRSLFHITFYMFVTIFLLFLCRKEKKKILIAAFVPFIIILSLYVKNFVLFDKFSASTWLGMNVWSMTTRNLSIDQRRQLVDEGKLSPVSLVERNSKLEKYPESFLDIEEYEHVQVLRQIKKANGENNYNNLAYITISDQYLKDAMYVLKNYPETYLTGLSRSWFSYFKSSSDYSPLAVNKRKLSAFNNVYDYIFYGKIPFNFSSIRQLPIYSDQDHYVYIFLLCGMPVLIFFGMRLSAGKYNNQENISRSRRIIIAYICFIIFYVAVIGNSLETGENNRFRFATDPLYVVLIGLFFQYRFKPIFQRYIQNKKIENSKNI